MMTRRIDEVRMVKLNADSEVEEVMMIIQNICTSKTYRLLFLKACLDNFIILSVFTHPYINPNLSFLASRQDRKCLRFHSPYVLLY